MRFGIVEDDRAVAAALMEALRVQRIDATHYETGAAMLLRHTEFDAIILDLGLPDADGIEVLRKLRKVSRIPVVVLTARDDERSTVLALRHGADDYVTKPARIFELLARVDAVIRRSQHAYPRNAAPGVESIGGVGFDREARVLIKDGSPIALTTKEFELLSILADASGAAVSREELLDRIWGDAYQAVSRSLDVHINALRSKLENPQLIQTIRGFGYRLVTG